MGLRARWRCWRQGHDWSEPWGMGEFDNGRILGLASCKRCGTNGWLEPAQTEEE